MVKGTDLDQEFTSPDQFRPNFLLPYMTSIILLASKLYPN